MAKGTSAYAVIDESGGQRAVRVGDEILVDLLHEGQAKPGQGVTFDRVLLVSDGSGKATIGHPLVAGAKVAGEVLEPVVMGDKVHIFKFGAKKGYKRKTGHRQRYSKVKITAIPG